LTHPRLPSRMVTMAEQTPQYSITPVPSSSAPTQWLSLKEASDFLGVHFTTLRTWADNGDIPVFRTPGGHRRFSIDDLRRFLLERSSHLASPDERGLVDVAVGRVRLELQRNAPAAPRWHYPLQGDAAQARRLRGQQLFSLAVSYVMKPGQRERLLESGRDLGHEYGREAALSGVGLVETGRAVQFFRTQLVEAVRSEEGSPPPDADDLRIQRLIDQFLDEVLYAVLDGYERSR
jgi:excisionase family DNA binding protein